jgi:hypothetical protein
VLIQKQKCSESLILRRGSDMFIDGEMSEKVGDVPLAHFVLGAACGETE